MFAHGGERDERFGTNSTLVRFLIVGSMREVMFLPIAGELKRHFLIADFTHQYDFDIRIRELLHVLQSRVAGFRSPSCSTVPNGCAGLQ